MSRVRRRRTAAAVASVATAAVILPLAFMAGPAQAVAATMATGLQAYVTGTGTASAISFNYDNGGGSNPTSGIVPATINGAVDPLWSPGGRRVVYATPDGSSIMSKDVYTGQTITLTTAPSGYADYPGTLSPDGAALAFVRVNTTSHDSSIYLVPTDGSFPAAPAFSNDGVNSLDTGAPEDDPISSPNGDIVVDRGGDIDDIVVDLSEQNNQFVESISFSTLVADASQPAFSPDGKYLAFVKDVDGVPQLWTATVNVDDESNAVQVSNVTQVSFDTSGATKPAWSPTGDLLSYGSTAGAKEVSVTEGTSGVTFGTPQPMAAADETYGTWQPLAPGAGVVTRVAGSNAIGTAIAASQHNYASANAVIGDDGTDDQGRIPAGAVVLSRSDVFYDALAGSAFAADMQAPLLMTPSASLNPAVKAEIERILPAQGTVYLLGGTSAISPAIATDLLDMGYTVRRLAGSNMYGTAVAVDQAISEDFGPPTQAIVATGTQYYDALAAGAAAASGFNMGTVIVLTQGTTMPAASAAYLNSLEGSMYGVPLTYTVGGPGNTAMQNALKSGTVTWGSAAQGIIDPLVGSNAPGTALKVAENLFEGPTTAAIATTNGWYDALTGGAMVAVDGGPLLLSSPTNLDPGVAAYLQQEDASLDSAEILGGTSAMPPALLTQVQNLIGLPDGVGGLGGLPMPFVGTRGAGSQARKSDALSGSSGSTSAAPSWWTFAIDKAKQKK